MPDSVLEVSAPGKLTEEEIVGQLNRILENRRFAPGSRLAKFLRYVVEKTLAGEGPELKETVLAMDLYDRSSDYDPKVNSVVRVEATRVRTRLQEYYATEGFSDPVRITLPRGGYVPTFERMETATAPLSLTPVAPSEESDFAEAVSPGNKLGRLNRKPRWGVLVICIAIATLATAGWSVRWPTEGHSEALEAWKEAKAIFDQDPNTATSAHGMPNTLRRAIERLEYAVTLDPQLAVGWAALAEAYDYAFPYTDRNGPEDARRAEEAALRAVALDEKLPDGHRILGTVLHYLRWDFRGAERSYRRALELEPRNVFTVVELVDLLRLVNRKSEAAEVLRRARALQPASVVLAVKESELQLDLGRVDAAIVAARLALELQRDFGRAHLALGSALERKGENAAALSSYEHALRLNPFDRRALPMYGHLLAKLNRTYEARSVLSQLRQLHQDSRNSAYQIAVVLVALGETDAGLDWLQVARDSHQVCFPFATVDWRLDAIRSHNRFTGLVKPVNPSLM